MKSSVRLSSRIETSSNMFWSTRGTLKNKKMNKTKSDIVPFLLCSKTFELMFEQQMKKIINKTSVTSLLYHYTLIALYKQRKRPQSISAEEADTFCLFTA